MPTKTENLAQLASIATGVSGQPLLSAGASVPAYGTLNAASGGTGATSLTANNVILGNGTSAVQFVAPGANGNVLTSNGTTWTSAAATSGLTGQTDSASPFETSLGSGAGANNTGVNNTFVGYFSGNATTTGTDNTAVGFRSLDANTTANYNTAVGSDALGANTTGSSNTAVGWNALLTSTTVTGNSAFGYRALANATAGTQVAFGYEALLSSTTGQDNSAFGASALVANTTGNNNVALGYRTLFSSTIGANNVAVGYRASNSNTSGNNTTSVGFQSLFSNTTGVDNTAVGKDAGDAVTTGTQNTFLGSGAGSSGTNDLTTGSNNTIIGYNAAASSTSVSNEITLGNSSIATLRCQVTTITSLSDARDKKDVVPLAAGLQFTNALRPVAFNWNMRDGGKVDIPDTGFIAQDLKAVQEQTGITIPGLVYESNPDSLEASYGKLLPVLVKAIQELSARVEALEAAQ